MIPGDLHVKQILSVLHSLQGGGVEVREVIQYQSTICISDLQISTVGLYQLVPDGIQRNGVLRIAIGNIVVVIGDCDPSYCEPLLFFHGVVML